MIRTLACASLLALALPAAAAAQPAAAQETGGTRLDVVATGEVSIRFRDIARTGSILDALVAQGANQINGPTLEIDRPEAALDEARTAALATARARAELYARALGMQVRRILWVSESGMAGPPFPRPVAVLRAQGGQTANIDPGEQRLSVALTVSFELQ